jgi:CubicO group peptidase (beta-lactamase class C family)
MTTSRVISSIYVRCKQARSRPACTLICAALALTGCAVTPPDLDQGARQLENRLTILEQQGFAGQVAVVQGENILVLQGFGQMDVDDDRPISAAAVLPLASLTKPFTASAVLALAAEGRLDLDEPIGNHLPGLDPHWADIAISHYLTHTAGLPAEIINRAWKGDQPRFEPVGRDEFVARLNHFEPDFPPGDGYNYSNVGYSLLAALIEQVAEEDYESYLRGTLLATAGISDIGFRMQGWQGRDLVSGRDGPERIGHYFEQPLIDGALGWNLRGSGDLLATPGGIIDWWWAIRDQRWLSTPWLDEWLTPRLDKPDGDRYGYGLIFRDSIHGPVIGHPGGDYTFSVEFSWFVDLDLMIYIATADTRFPADLLRDDLHRLLLGRL